MVVAARAASHNRIYRDGRVERQRPVLFMESVFVPRPCCGAAFETEEDPSRSVYENDGVASLDSCLQSIPVFLNPQRFVVVSPQRRNRLSRPIALVSERDNRPGACSLCSLQHAMDDLALNEFPQERNVLRSVKKVPHPGTGADQRRITPVHADGNKNRLRCENRSARLSLPSRSYPGSAPMIVWRLIRGRGYRQRRTG